MGGALKRRTDSRKADARSADRVALVSLLVALAGCTTAAEPDLHLGASTLGTEPAVMQFSGTPQEAPETSMTIAAAGSDTAPDAQATATETVKLASVDAGNTGVSAAAATVPVPIPRPGEVDAPTAEAPAPAITMPQTAPPRVDRKPGGFLARLFASPPQSAVNTASKTRPGRPQEAEPPQGAELTSAPSLTAPSPLVAQTGPTSSGTAVASVEPATYVQPAPPAKKQGLFNRLFSSRPPAAHAAEASTPVVEEAVLTTDTKAAPVVASLTAPAPVPSYYKSLPGVRKDAGLEITQIDGKIDETTIDAHETMEPVQVASAGGLARLDAHGLLLQRDTVETACLRPPLLNVLKKIEAHYGEKLVITSGYRTTEANQRAHGAKNSLHTFCAAADIQVPGISKWDLASYIRSMPGRGGVGTYCYTDSVHVDIGPERDWNWRCRRRKK